jgi:hypothetical protein
MAAAFSAVVVVRFQVRAQSHNHNNSTGRPGPLPPYQVQRFKAGSQSLDFFFSYSVVI